MRLESNNRETAGVEVWYQRSMDVKWQKQVWLFGEALPVSFLCSAPICRYSFHWPRPHLSCWSRGLNQGSKHASLTFRPQLRTMYDTDDPTDWLLSRLGSLRSTQRKMVAVMMTFRLHGCISLVSNQGQTSVCTRPWKHQIRVTLRQRSEGVNELLVPHTCRTSPPHKLWLAH